MIAVDHARLLAGRHRITAWGDREGVQHRRCCCGAEGSGTAAQAEAAVAGCRTAGGVS